MHIFHNADISQLYLGENFTIDRLYHSHDLLSEYNVIVSPANRQIFANEGVPFYKKDNKPVLDECGNGLYRLCRNGKWGVIDARMNQILPFKYDYVWYFDKNDLIMVRIDGHYGLVDKQGEEQVSPKYEDVSKNNDGTYSVKLDGSEFRIDKFGNRL